MTNIAKMNKHKIHVIDDQIKVIFTNNKIDQFLYAAYLFDKRSVFVEKRNYQKSEILIFNNLPKGEYYLRLFLKKKSSEDKVSWMTAPQRINKTVKKDMVEELLLLAVREEEKSDYIKKLIFTYPAYLPSAFKKIRWLVQSGGENKKNIERFANEMVKFLHLENLTTGQEIFLLNAILYTATANDLINSEQIIKKKLLNEKKFPVNDLHFIKGLYEYRCGNYINAQKEFQVLAAYQENLLFYQTGCISYFHSWNEDSDQEVSEELELNLIRVAENHDKAIVLISCDYGYFMAYFDQTIRNLNKFGHALHVHIILPQEIGVDKIKEKIGSSNVGISVETESKEQRGKKNRRTYYAVSRYLILSKIIELYKSNVLVSDIDIDFSKSLKKAVSSVAEDEIALYFSNSYLPWSKILAGFNIFGSGTAKTEFLIKLNQILNFCLKTNRDGWMLDQTALEVAYQSCSSCQKNKFKSITKVLGFTPKQYDNRHNYRSHAQNALLEIEKNNK